MKIVVAVVASALLLIPASPAAAGGRPSARPVIKIVGVGPSPEAGSTHRIVLQAVDPDGIIGEVMVDLGDGVVAWLLLFCDPETTRPGDTQTVELDWSYQPGTYVIRAQAYSTTGCFEGQTQKSRPATRATRVR